MTEFLYKMRKRGVLCVQLSSLYSLLFFALLLGVHSANVANAQQAQGGWSIDAETETEKALTDSDKEQAPVGDGMQQAQQEGISADAKLDEQEAAEQVAVDKESDAAESELSADADPTKPQSAEQAPKAAASTLPNIQSSRIETTPVVDLDPQLRDNLERQFQRIREIQENEDAFSEKLGEAYLSYGEALKQAGRLDEAQAMYANALHISKINNGVNSIEQRPMLRAMFEMNEALGVTQKMEENVKRTIWLEKNYSDEKDDQSFEMVVKLGNHYLDRYLYRPTASEANLGYLNQAIRYLGYAVDRYGDYPMDELFMPYGELALAHFLRSKIQLNVSRPSFNETRQRQLPEYNRIEPIRNSSGKAFSSAQRYLTQYLLKARQEGRDEDITLALLNLGDINLLFGRLVGAALYYEQAWQQAQNLPVDHPLVTGFDQPLALPSFKYALDRGDVVTHFETVRVPLTFNLDLSGRVKGFADINADESDPELIKRAKRAAKRMLFRPVIENGKMIATRDTNYDIKVVMRSKKANRS